jgi:hypothetical protein
MLGVLPAPPDVGEVTEMYVNPEDRRRERRPFECFLPTSFQHLVLGITQLSSVINNLHHATGCSYSVATVSGLYSVQL